MDKKHYRLMILGSGPAGCTAAIYTARANLDFSMVTGSVPGGQLLGTPKIANWPGEPDEIPGIALMEKMLNQVRKFSNNVISDNIEKVDLTRRPFYLQGSETEYTCDALIIATGASAKSLGLPSEAKYMGRGISSCAICDGFFYKNKPVVVIGGGNTSAEDALYLAKIASQVTIIHRRDILRAEKWLINSLKKTSNIKFELNYNVIEILGDEQGVTGVHIKEVNSNNTKKITTPGVFIAIGHKPNTEIFSRQLAMEHDYIKIGYNYATATSIPGVFAAGDAATGNYHQAIIAAGTGCTAAFDAKAFLDSRGL